MIDAKELRVGNIVYIEMPMLPTWQYHRIKGQDISDIETGAIGKIGVINIHPVPLTPELLKKLGSDTGTYISVWGSIYIHLALDPECILKPQREWTYHIQLCDHTNDDITIIDRVDLRHLHQLQNLIYILSGNELNVEI